jgi:SAM-dependent methyltransferase
MRVIRNTFARIFGRRARLGPAGRYTSLNLDEKAISLGDHKNHLGGGAEKWEMRGLFQLDLLRRAGLQPSHRVIDIGCGPIRAGEHFIRYLDRGNYCGIDYNVDFIRAAELTVAGDLSLSRKAPVLKTVRNFEFAGLGKFDFGLSWSVLNHCDLAQRDLFFKGVGQILTPGAKLFISHGSRLSQADFDKAGLTVRTCFAPSDIDLGKYGWPAKEQKHVCPIFELSRI